MSEEKLRNTTNIPEEVLNRITASFWRRAAEYFGDYQSREFKGGVPMQLRCHMGTALMHFHEGLQPNEHPICWWNGFRPSDDPDAEPASFRDHETTWHDIPVFAGFNPQSEFIKELSQQRDELLAALKACLHVMERYAVQEDAEWGVGRPLSTIEKDGDLPQEIIAGRAAIAKVEGKGDE